MSRMGSIPGDLPSQSKGAEGEEEGVGEALAEEEELDHMAHSLDL